jgi:hypothetical protein
MPDDAEQRSPTTLRAVAATSIREIPADIWNQLANPDPAHLNPFVSHEFLLALETSGSADANAGWRPAHVKLMERGEIVGVAPLYVKGHSFGEYVFDHHWAEAYERAGGRYYPKLVAAVPFSPVPGPRLLAATQDKRAALATAIASIASDAEFSSAHVNFFDENQSSAFEADDWLIRLGVQYHWRNNGYTCFDDFLAELASRKRKAIRRERREAQSGIVIRRIQGAEVTESVWDHFWRFYQDTGSRKWGRPYLTRSFFSLLGEKMRDRLLLVFAEAGGQPIAGALNLIGGDALYGRYWGRTEDRPFLHFEVCYHQAIEFAIERGLSRVEAGAQGEHKLARGYRPVATWSAHWIADERFRLAISRYLRTERPEVEAALAALDDHTPFKDTRREVDG